MKTTVVVTSCYFLILVLAQSRNTGWSEKTLQRRGNKFSRNGRGADDQPWAMAKAQGPAMLYRKGRQEEEMTGQAVPAGPTYSVVQHDPVSAMAGGQLDGDATSFFRGLNPTLQTKARGKFASGDIYVGPGGSARVKTNGKDGRKVETLSENTQRRVRVEGGPAGAKVSVRLKGDGHSVVHGHTTANEGLPPPRPLPPLWISDGSTHGMGPSNSRGGASSSRGGPSSSRADPYGAGGAGPSSSRAGPSSSRADPIHSEISPASSGGSSRRGH